MICILGIPGNHCSVLHLDKYCSIRHGRMQIKISFSPVSTTRPAASMLIDQVDADSYDGVGGGCGRTLRGEEVLGFKAMGEHQEVRSFASLKASSHVELPA